MENVKLVFIIGCFFIICLDIAETKCTISKGWIEMPMEERLLMSEVVVYGKTKEHRANVKKISGKSYYEIDAIFDVYCVLRSGEEATAEEIIIEKIAPRDGCSGTRNHMKIGEEAIVGLKITSEGKYVYDEVMPTQSASFAATKSNLHSISSICELQSWSAPVNATSNRCPICEVGNFTESVMDSVANEKISPCFIDGFQVGNGTNCNIFTTNNIDSSSTCIPANFDLTCARILSSTPSVTCDCVSTPLKKMNLHDLGEIDAGVLFMPCAMTMITSLLAVFMSA